MANELIEIKLNATEFNQVVDLVKKAIDDHLETLIYLSPDSDDNRRYRKVATKMIEHYTTLAATIGEHKEGA